MQQVQMWPFLFMTGVIRDVGLCAKRFVLRLRWDAFGEDIWAKMKGRRVAVSISHVK
jgi:hypothetical protein